MATITDWAVTTTAAPTADGLRRAYVLKNTINFATVNTAASDVVQVLSIPANTYVMDVVTVLTRAEGGTLTATLGDGGSAAGWDGSINLNTTAGTVTQSVNGTDARAAANAAGYVYTSADTIDLTMSANAADYAIIEVYAICFDLN